MFNAFSAGAPVTGVLAPRLEVLPEDVVVRLRSDPTAALAAVMIVAVAFPDIAWWAVRASSAVSSRALCFGDRSNDGDGSNGCGGEGTDGTNVPGGSGSAGPNVQGASALNPPSTPSSENSKRSRGRPNTGAKERLLALMRANPGATVSRLAELSGASRAAIVMALKRLEKTGLVEHGAHGNWAAVHATPVETATPSAAPRWIAPLSGRHLARFTAAGRVREMAAL